MTAFLSDGIPSTGVYLTSPSARRAAAPRTAEIGVLFLGSPIPRLITASPRSLRSRASSFRRRVGDSAIERASWLSAMDGYLQACPHPHRPRSWAPQLPL